MNVFELSALACPMVGIIAGIRTTQGSAWPSVISGLAIGVTVGVLVYLTAVVPFRIANRLRAMGKGGHTGWLMPWIGPIEVLLPMAAPFITWPLSSAIVRAVLT